MADFSEQQIKRILILGSASFAFLLALLFSLYIWLDLQRTEREARTRLMDEAFALSETAGMRLRSAQIVLSTTQVLIEQQGGLDNLVAGQLQQLLQNQLAKFSSEVGEGNQHRLFAVDTSGQLIARSDTNGHLAVDQRQQAYFQSLQSRPGQGAYLGQFQRIEDPAFKVLLALPLSGIGGSFAGVLGITLAQQKFEEFSRQIALRQGEATTLFRRDGKLLFRDPAVADMADLGLENNPELDKLFTRMITQGRGSDRIISPLDGMDRLFGFYNATEYPMLAVVSQSYQSALKPWRNNLIHTSGLFIGLVLGLLVMLLLALRQLASIDTYKQTEQALRDANRQLRDTQGMIDRFVIMSDTDLYGTITYASDAFCNISGYRESELLGQSHRIVRHPDMPSSTFEELWRTIRSGNTWIGELQNRRKDGSSYWVEATIVPVVDDEGNCTGYRGIRQDITDKKLAQRLAVTDHLTGLSNRSKLDQQLHQQINYCARYEDDCSLVLMDIDYFKQVNDDFGHQIGDLVLKEVARILGQRTRETDTVGRWGGEEFLIIMPHTDQAGAAELAEQLRQEMEKHNFSSGQQQSGSFGVSAYRQGDSVESMLSRVDDALYRAKKLGRNRVEQQLPPTSTTSSANRSTASEASSNFDPD